MGLLEIFKALSDENRLRIFYLLLQKELCVCEIEALLDMTQSNASRHLTKMKQVGLIDSYKNAQWVYYKVNDSLIKEHSELYEYLQKRLEFKKDSERLTRYTNSVLDCVCIKEDREKVMTYLSQEVKVNE